MNLLRSVFQFIFLLSLLALTTFGETMSREDLIAQANLNREKKDFEKSRLLYQAWLKDNPNDQEVQFWLAQVLSWEKFYDEAKEIYSHLLQLNAQNVEADFALAQVLSWQGYFNESLARLDRLLKLHPDNAEFRAERDRILKEIESKRSVQIYFGGDFKSYDFYPDAGLGLKASFSYADAGTWAIRGGAYGVSRFGQKAAQLSVGGSFWFTPNWVLELDADISTHSDIMPLYSGALSSGITIAKAATPSVTLQVGHYSDATGVTVIPALSWSILSYLELTAKLYGNWTSFANGKTSGNISGMAKFDFAPFDYFSLNVGTSAGEEPFDPGEPTFPLGSFFSQHLFGGIKFTMEGHLGAQLNFDQEWRSNGQRIFSGDVSLFYRW